MLEVDNILNEIGVMFKPQSDQQLIDKLPKY